MIVKFLKNSNGGSTASIDYVLNKKRVADGTARILRGNEKDTRTIINSLTKKQKVSFCVMSFEEKNIEESLKYKLMDEFEKTFFAGLSKSQYDVLWVEHTDKNRLELNAIIPKVELSTKRAFNPYNHKTDLHIKDLFTKKINLEYGFSCPNDPRKEAPVQGTKKEKKIFDNYKELDKVIYEMVGDGLLNSRNDIINFLESNNIIVNRKKDGEVHKKYIAVKLNKESKAKRLKGEIFDERFREIRDLENITRERKSRIQEYDRRDVQQELRGICGRFEKALRKRESYNREFYSRAKKQNGRTSKEGNEHNGRTYARNGNTQEVHNKTRQTSKRDDFTDGRVEKAGEQRYIKKDIQIVEDKKNDRIRRDVAEAVREREERKRTVAIAIQAGIDEVINRLERTKSISNRDSTDKIQGYNTRRYRKESREESRYKYKIYVQTGQSIFSRRARTRGRWIGHLDRTFAKVRRLSTKGRDARESIFSILERNRNAIRKIATDFSRRTEEIHERVREYTNRVQASIKEYNRTAEQEQYSNKTRAGATTATKQNAIITAGRARDYSKKYNSRKLEIKEKRKMRKRTQKKIIMTM